MLQSESSVTLILPGLQNSGPTHWQSHWQADRQAHWQAADGGLIRVEQKDWNVPDLAAWADAVVDAVRKQEQPVVLVAHSFACLAALHASLELGHRIAAALLVAPADPDKFGVAALLPQSALPFPGMVVASRNDPWMPFEKAAAWAGRWNSQLVDLGAAGHINAESGYGPWPEGLALLQTLCQSSRHPEKQLVQAVPVPYA